MSDSKELVVQQKLKVVPERRTAEYSVPLGGSDAAYARVNRQAIGFSTSKSYSESIPKTLEAVDAIIALFGAVREELVVQGVTE